ncbi:MAG TPA: L-threonylcarbamoyladenylate synthase [Pirellulales bacterium]|nr:L-threonylcarbamoyladenylate synthase [Pirellulales bacterium]
MFNPRKTTVHRVSAEQPEAAIIAEAAAVLQRGGLVAFPTETVYGLGASALDANAVEQIFAAKGRPPNNPVIVHVADATAAERLTSKWSDVAARLAARFWPGPLTLVLPKRPEVPDMVTAGGPTVGLRVPAHPVALALLKAADIPIAAPSANRSTRISPTTAVHVLQGLDGRVDLILDGGPTPRGLESTVLDLTVDPPRVLRPGLVTLEQLRTVIGEAAIGDRSTACRQPSVLSPTEPLRSPGMLARHYAPRAKVVCVEAGNESVISKLLAESNGVGWLRLEQLPATQISGVGRIKAVIDMPRDPAGYAARLYAALHELDDAGVEYIVVDLPPTDDTWLAIHDRLRRAAQTE